MKILKEPIPDLKLLEPAVFGDHRGYFYESYSTEVFHKLGIFEKFVQDNQSMSNKGVLRGLHFQKGDHVQGKLVRVVVGAVFDVAVDIRKGSPTYGQWFGCELNEDNKHLLWVPPGFAHGFATLKDGTVFNYKCTNLYHKESEGGIMYNDSDLNIDWHLENPVLSEKDLQNETFKSFNSPFTYAG